MNMRTCSLTLMLAVTPLLASAEGQSSRFTDSDAFLLGIIDSTGHPTNAEGSTAAGNICSCMPNKRMNMQSDQKSRMNIRKHSVAEDWYDEYGHRRTPHEYQLRQ